jgi:adenylate kinase
MLRIVLLGPPAAGKGTMSRIIREHYGISILSTGEILREEISKGTELGKAVKDLMDKGKLVPDDIVINIIKEATRNMDNGYLFDGFPRNINQAKALDNMLLADNGSLNTVLYLNTDDKVLIDRVSKRLVCPKCGRPYHMENVIPMVKWICDSCGTPLVQRKDDNPEFFKERLKIYHESTKPLVDYYSSKGILKEIDSSRSMDEQFDEIKAILDAAVETLADLNITSA